MLYDKEFTVYDIRVRKQLCKFGKWDEKACKISVKNPEGREPLDITNDKEVVDIYFDKYLPSVRELQVGQSLRDCDRALWAKDWSEDLDEFLRTRK